MRGTGGASTSNATQKDDKEEKGKETEWSSDAELDVYANDDEAFTCTLQYCERATRFNMKVNVEESLDSIAQAAIDKIHYKLQDYGVMGINLGVHVLISSTRRFIDSSVDIFPEQNPLAGFKYRDERHPVILVYPLDGSSPYKDNVQAAKVEPEEQHGRGKKFLKNPFSKPKSDEKLHDEKVKEIRMLQKKAENQKKEIANLRELRKKENADYASALGRLSGRMDNELLLQDTIALRVYYDSMRVKFAKAFGISPDPSKQDQFKADDYERVKELLSSALADPSAFHKKHKDEIENANLGLLFKGKEALQVLSYSYSLRKVLNTTVHSATTVDMEMALRRHNAELEHGSIGQSVDPTELTPDDAGIRIKAHRIFLQLLGQELVTEVPGATGVEVAGV